LEVALFEPRIPQNTGNIARSCAAFNIPLNLIEPLGFKIEDKYLKRAGLDYWPLVTVNQYENFEKFLASKSTKRIISFSKKNGLYLKDFKFKRFFDHTVYYSLYENFYKCKFFFDVSGRQKISELSKKWNIRKKQKILKKSLKGKDIFIADVTPREIEKTSLRIVRSYSPELFNLECGETIYNLSFIKKRVSKINKALKRKTVPLNTAPHCYP